MTKKLLALTVLCLATACCFQKAYAQDAYIGEIRMFAGNYAPVNWMTCEGQLLPINQYTALFSILGTTYGGNGTTNFALPDLRGRLPMGQGSGPGLATTYIGDQQGAENFTLTTANMPAHNHNINIYNGNGTIDTLSGSGTAYPALVLNPDLSRSAAFTTTPPNATLHPATVSVTGSNLPVSNKQPSLSLTFIICVNGIWPTHP